MSSIIMCNGCGKFIQDNSEKFSSKHGIVLIRWSYENDSTTYHLCELCYKGFKEHFIAVRDGNRPLGKLSILTIEDKENN